MVPVFDDLSKLSDVVKNDVVRKAVYGKLVEKVNNIDTSTFDLKTQYDTDKSEPEKKILIQVDLLKRQIIGLKLVKLKVKYLVFVVQLQMQN